MKIKINTEVLKKAVNVATKATAAKALNSAIESFKLVVEQPNTLNIVAYNMLNLIQATCECEVEEDGEMLIDAKTLNNILSKVQSVVVTISYDGKKACVASGRSRYTLIVNDVSTFPDTPLVRNQASYTLPGGVVKEAYKKVAPFIRKNDKQPILQGVYINTQNGVTEFVGCDGYSLGVYSAETNADDSVVIIPKETLKNIVGILEDDTRVDIFVGSRHLKIVTNNYTFVCPMLSGKYLDYKNVLSSARDGKKIKINVDNFKHAIDSATPLIESFDKTPVVMDFTAETIEITSTSCIGAMKTKCPCDTAEYISMKMGMNATFLTNALNGCESEDVEITISNPSSPLFVEDGVYQAIVLPMRLRAN